MAVSRPAASNIPSKNGCAAIGWVTALKAFDGRSATYLPRLLNSKLRQKHRVSWQQTALIAWTGMRGADSLAGALAIPFLLPSGEPFPGRNIILLLTFCVIFATLALQGLTIAPLTRWLGIVDDHVTEREERLARLKANEAALAHVEAVESLNRVKSKTIERLRTEYVDRIEQLRGEELQEKRIKRLFSRDFEELAREALEAERDTVITLRNEEIINDEAFRRIQHDIDLAEARLQRPA
jgi:monovalent cation/hydrogen antiporter